MMVYSSGTTGASKGIVLTNDGINATIAHYQTPEFPYDRRDSFLTIVPPMMSTGVVFTALMPLVLGMSVILEPVFSEQVFARDILKYKPAMVMSTMSHWLYVIADQKMQAADLSFLKYPISGGEKILPEDERKVNQFLAAHGCNDTLLKGYGMCELGSTALTTSRTRGKPGSVGYPILHAKAAVYDKETELELPYNKRGELRVCTPAHMKGYFRNPEATAAFFQRDEDGQLWGCTGDVGYIDEDGFVFICGRASDTYHDREGHIVYAFDAEDIILRCDFVAAVKVVETKVGGQPVSVAHLVMKKNASDKAQEALTLIAELLKSELPEAAWPIYYKLREGLPVHPNGKRDIEAMKHDTEGLRLFPA